MSSARRRFLRAIRETLGARAVGQAHPERLAASTDLWPKHLLQLRRGSPPAEPYAVVWPESTEAVRFVVQQARRWGVPLVPYGAGSSVVGGAWACNDHVVLDLKRMNRVLELDRRRQTATAETGILGELFERHLQRSGYTQGHFPSSIYCSTLGGWVAARGAGQMSSRYGKIEDQVVGGVVVLGDGSIARFNPSPTPPPELAALIGSEGALGIWTQATVRIHPLPEQRLWRGFSFPDLEHALDAARHWLEAGLSPSVLRIYDPLDSLLQKTTSGHTAPHDRGPSLTAAVGARLPRLLGLAAEYLAASCRCVVGLQGPRESVAAQLSALLEIAHQHGARDLGPGPGEAWYARRYAVSYRQSNALRAGVLVDTMEVACPWERVSDVYHAVRKAGRQVRAQVLAHFSHLYLDGASIYFTFALPASRGQSGYAELWRVCLEAAVAAGANVSHHHGVGQLKGGELAKRLGPRMQVLEALRQRWDPSGVLNPRVLRATDAPQSSLPPGPAKPDARGSSARPNIGVQRPSGLLRATSDAPGSSARPDRPGRPDSLRRQNTPASTSQQRAAAAESTPTRQTAARAGGTTPASAPSSAFAWPGWAHRDAPAQRSAYWSTLPERPMDVLAGELARHGLSLGPWAPFFTDRTVGELARARRLWRYSPQLRVIEPVLVGANFHTSGADVPPMLAPRAAVGPELDVVMAWEQVARLWLRAYPLAGARAWGEVEAQTGLDILERWTRNEVASAASLVAWGGPARLILVLDLPELPLAELVEDWCVRLAPEVQWMGGPVPRVGPVPRTGSVPFCGAWPEVRRLLAVCAAEDVHASLPWIDALGAAGVLHGAEGSSLDAERAARLAVWVSELGLDGRWRPEAEAAQPAQPAAPWRLAETPARAQSNEASAAAPAPPVAGQRQPQAPDTGAGAERPTPKRLRLWQYQNQLDNCTYCPKLCRFACPVAVADGTETLTPRQLMLTAGLDHRGRRNLATDVAEKLWSCVDCRGCHSFCDHGNEVPATLQAARQQLLRMGAAPPRVQGVVAHMRAHGCMPDRPVSAALPQRIAGDAEPSRTWLFLGCQNEPDATEYGQAALALARYHFGPVRVANEALSCCGHPLARWGDRQGFRAHARAFARQFRGLDRLVVDDPGCVYTLRVLYAQLGVRTPAVTSTGELLHTEIREGAWPMPPEGRWAPADSCWASRYLGEPSLRQLLGGEPHLGKGSVLEGQAGCCGGMLLPFYDPQLADAVAKRWAADALGGGGSRVLCQSPTCRRRLRAVGVPTDDLVRLWYQRQQGQPIG